MLCCTRAVLIPDFPDVVYVQHIGNFGRGEERLLGQRGQVVPEPHVERDVKAVFGPPKNLFLPVRINILTNGIGI